MFKNDKYKRARGNYSRLLAITCADCGEYICKYQKDGPGILKRMYLDRIFESSFEKQEEVELHKVKEFICTGCKQLLGTPIIYKKEARLAYRLFVGSIIKKITKSGRKVV